MKFKVFRVKVQLKDNLVYEIQVPDTDDAPKKAMEEAVRLAQVGHTPKDRWRSAPDSYELDEVDTGEVIP